MSSHPDISGKAAWMEDVVRGYPEDLSAIADALLAIARIPKERRRRAIDIVSVLVFDSLRKNESDG